MGVVVKALVAGLAFTLGAQAAVPAEADWTWLEQHRARALEALMPVGAGSTYLVTYRSYRDLYQDEHESYFTIPIGDRPGTSPERLTATLILPIEKSIQQQLLELHMSNRQGTLESLLPRVLVQRLDVAQDRCPVLRVRVEALPRLSISVSDPNVIFHHHVIHRLVIDTASERVDARLIDPESSAVRWAVETFKALKACEGRNP